MLSSSSAADTMLHLTKLPPEVIHNILSFVNPEDLFPVLCTSRFLRDFVSGNSPLCQAIYLRHLDKPPAGSKPAWEKELRDLVKLRLICASSDMEKKKKEFSFVYHVFTRLLENSSTKSVRKGVSMTYPASRNADTLAKLFDAEENRNAFLCRSFIYEWARGNNDRPTTSLPPKEEQQMSAKLQCLYGLYIRRRGRTGSSAIYPFACSRVYDLRQYTEASRWGPFMADGSDRTDWEKVEAILVVLRSNIKSKGLDDFPVFGNIWNTAFAGTWPKSYLPTPMHREPTALELRDPYDVSGTWLRIVCFLDYSDFFTFNFPDDGDDVPADMPRHALTVGEATRVILMKLRVTEIEAPGENDNQDLPVVHFKGISRSLDGSWDENANSDLRGTCRLTPDGEVRWTIISVFDGEPRWRSEGIQLGGLRSARGVLANWFDTDYDPHGPCGPTGFWKICDREQQGDQTSVDSNDFLPLLDGARGTGMYAVGIGDHHVESMDEDDVDAEDDDDDEDGDEDDEEGDDDDEVEVQVVIPEDLETPNN